VHSGLQPLSFGVPLPRGLTRSAAQLVLVGPDGKAGPVQTEPLLHWPDGSIQWLLVDAVLGRLPEGESDWRLLARPWRDGDSPLRIRTAGSVLAVETGRLGLSFQQGSPKELFRTRAYGSLRCDVSPRCRCTCGRETFRLERVVPECAGPVRVTVRLTGKLGPARFIARVSAFAGTSLVKVQLTIRNLRRARHPGGLWDLGDAGSVLLRELALVIRPSDSAFDSCAWQVTQEGAWQTAHPARLEIYQDSSGGPNWQNRTHVSRSGRSPCRLAGYRIRTPEGEAYGSRAEPRVQATTRTGTLAVAVPEFWQQFPRSLEVTPGQLVIGLFPRQSAELHELQGGEQKTHTLWLDFAGGARETLGWVHDPAHVKLPRDWWAGSRVLLGFPRDESWEERRLDAYLDEVLRGPNRLDDRREKADEYGWRNHGELHADHEEQHAKGPLPIVSHYNNQYDFVHGGLLQFCRTGDGHWLRLADALARHVIDIDIYHTHRDKAAYNGGLFWHTDHYRDAATATHRAFSRANTRPGQPSGGGPCNEHNYTSGLLLYHCMTGDPQAREAVLSLADWVIAMDDGRQHPAGALDPGPTGLASQTGEPGYHGPGRGAGNSLNALLDAWLLTHEPCYLAKTEELLHRCIHPRDEIAARQLMNIELRWSYTVFLEALARYLDIKREHGALDAKYAYARASLLHYAEWMLANERPYFDQVERMEYATETWAAQELRKANVLGWAARHAAEPLRSRLLVRCQQFTERAWSDLERFDTRTSTRAVAIVLRQGLWNLFVQDRDEVEAELPSPMLPLSNALLTPGNPASFVPQRERIRQNLRRPVGLLKMGLRLAAPWNWPRLWSLVRR
jgi:hypothetical protein